MVQILLVILKTIGLVLAAVLGLLLFLFLLIMLGPIRYRAEGKSDGKISLESNISWLFFVFRCKVKYNEEGLAWYARFLGVLFASNDKDFLAKKEAKRARKMKTEPLEEPISEAVKAEQHPETVKQETVQEVLNDTPKELMGEKTEQKAQPIRQEKKTKKFFINIKKKITDIPQKIRGVIDRFQEIKEKLLRIKEFFFGEQNKEVMKFILLNMKKMLLHILPDKFQGRVEFGLEDPYTMGQVLAVLGILMPIYQDKLVVIPDFEEQKLKGDFSLKGTIIPGYLILRLFIVIMNKEVRRVIREGKRLIGGNV